MFLLFFKGLMPPHSHQRYTRGGSLLLKMAIEIVDLPIENGDFP